MSWSEGIQKYNKAEDINDYIGQLEGFIDEKEAKILLYKFLKEMI